MIWESVTIAIPAALKAGDFFGFKPQMVFRGGNDLCNHLEMQYDVQRCKISDESIRHALPMGQHIHIFAARAAISLRVQCRRLQLNALWMLGFFLFFFRSELFGGCVIRGWGKDMDCFAAFPLFQQRESARHLPCTFWIAHKR